MTSVLSQEEQLKIKHILLTHAHLDHFHELHFLVDNRLVGESEDKEIHVYSHKKVLEAIHKGVFNNIIWPDYTKIPQKNPLLYLHPIESKPFHIEKLKVQAVSVNHATEALGFIVDDGSNACVFSGDTYETEAMWKVAQTYKNLKAVFLDLSYSNRKKDLVSLARHHCTETFLKEIKKIPKNVKVYAYHLKPHFYKEIEKELKGYHIEIVTKGQVIKLI
ncbi:MAG: MBL fold metallo-hydrolase [Deltaproteobacteria bacterium]|nr:MBL fold metallo-hydrolase [Deltaproteobacteria bacterium]